MSESMLNALENQGNRALTENGAVSYATTKSEVLDFFSQGGALRNCTAGEQISMFARAWNEDPLLALKAMFYFRDVRGGQGQRCAFRNQLNYLADVAPETVRKNLVNVPFYGRWDDVYSLDGTAVEGDAFELLVDQFKIDMTGADAKENISLLAKWMKSENASSDETKRLATKTRKALGWSSKRYRKALSALRAHLDVVERKISSGEWKAVEYSHVPSNAMMKYRNAFKKHDGNRFDNFIEAVNSGEEKINSSALYPHEIVGKLLGYSNTISPEVAQAMWDGLPDFIGEEENSIAVVDVSGSMSGTPMEVAIGLGIYLAEHAKGVFKDRFITFSGNPKLQKVEGSNIATKVQGLRRADWDMNTDIEKVFKLVLDAAVTNNIPQEEMIDKLYIISDMEFDAATDGNGGWGSRRTSTRTPDATLFQEIEKKFAVAGYKMPNLVFWNVDARNQQFPMSMDERGFQNVSGFSPSIFQSLVGGEFVSAYDLMLEVLNSERYNAIEV